MKLKYVKAKNFKSFPDNETKIDLDNTGLTLITGQNGSGKTSIFDAILWGLYGKSKVNVDKIINRKQGKNCKVEIGFVIGNNDYSVLRYREHETHGNNLYLFKGKKDISFRKKSDTENKILDVIGINYVAMTSAIILTSELYDTFLRSEVSKRLKKLESILSLKEINDYYKQAKVLRNEADKFFENKKVEREKAEVLLESLNDSIAEYRENSKIKLLKLKEEKGDLKEKIQFLEKELENLNEINVEKELEEIDKFEKASDKNEEIRKQIEEEKANLKEVDKKVNEYNSLKAKLEDLKSIDVNENFEYIDNYNTIISENKEINYKISNLLNEQKDVEPIDKEIKRLKREIESLESEIERINSNKEKCPTCGQTVDYEIIENLITEKDGLLKENKKELIENKVIAKQYRNDNENILIQIDELREKLQEEPDPPKFDKEYLNKISETKNKIKSDMSLLESEIKSNERYNKEINDRIKKQESLLVAINEPKYRKEFIQNLKDQIEEKQKEIEECNKKISEIDATAKATYDKKYVENSLEKIKNIKRDIGKKKKEEKEALINLNHWDAIKEVFSNKEGGVKKYLINKMIPVLNKKINSYVSFFFDKKIEVSFNEDLSERILLEGKEISFDEFSSGQKARLEIAVAFSLFFMARVFFSANINLLVFDEILDMNLDMEGVNSAIEILFSISETSTVFLVSHKEELKRKIDRNINVKLIEDETKLEFNNE